MNVSYKIERDAIFVTDEKGVIRKTSKFTNIEEVLQLQNEIEAVNILLGQKKQQLKENTRKPINVSQLNRVMNICIPITVFSIALAALGPFSILWICSAVLAFLGMTTSAHYIDRQNRTEANCAKFMRDIYYLEEMKKQAEENLKRIKMSIGSPVQQETTEVPIREFDEITVLKQCMKLFEGMSKEDISLSDVAVVSNIMNQVVETEKQKTLGARENLTK